MPIVEVRNLSVMLDRHPILHNVNFEIEEGESIAIIGPNGSGKTVLLKSMLGILPYDGVIHWRPGVTVGYVPLRFLGALLVGAMIIVPAAVGRRLTNSLDWFLIVSSAASVAAVGIGFAIASRWHLALGPTIVGVASAMFALTLLRRG
ncbi:MAG TPA: ATP-binding cassette domain-containing protein [Thermoanaerobaculia bacterium]